FMRGLLQHDHGVDLSGVQWVEGGLNDTKPHGAPNKIPLTRPVSIETSADKSLNDLLVAGEIAATIGSALPKAVGRHPGIDRLFGADPWPYGIEANRPTLEAMVQYLADQSLIAAPVPIEQLFVPIFGQGARG